MWFLFYLAVASLIRGTAVIAVTEPRKCIMYLTGQHNVVPENSFLVDRVSHVILAFMRSEIFNDNQTTTFPLFNTVNETRAKFSPATRIMVAIGGWGDSAGFEDAARTPESRRRWTTRVNAMVESTGADGVDIDWEYPGGNRDDYKQIPNDEREWEVEGFVALLEELRLQIGQEKILSMAVPAMERDLMAFSAKTMPRITKAVDFINVMTYDMMNRRDETVQHHSGLEGSQKALQRYIDRGAPAAMLNLGLGYYVKWFMTEQCDDGANPIGCRTQQLEDPETGQDLGRTGAFSWHDETPSDLSESFKRANNMGSYFDNGSYGYWDALEKRWWSFDTPYSIGHKVPKIFNSLQLGGVFAWGLGEDAPEFRHLRATILALRELDGEDQMKDEL